VAVARNGRGDTHKLTMISQKSEVSHLALTSFHPFSAWTTLRSGVQPELGLRLQGDGDNDKKAKTEKR
jgi:hypothetical protein